MNRVMTATPEVPRQGRHRSDVANEVSRMSVVAEAKVLVRQLDEYLALMADWLEDDLEGEDAGE